jgi:outer membrane receptor protein involved in Fe transport
MAAYAQEAGSDAGAGTGNVLSVEEITVTGSRIRRTTDFDTANPTTVVDASYLQNLGIVNVGDAVKQLPANLSNNTPATTGNANFFTGSTIVNLRGLNPFFGSRTLNLINTRRFVPTNQGDGVDLNFIPSILIDRIDVVTGGASAAYGSGAISGVNNIFLNRKLEGGKAEIDFGQTAESDGDDKHVAVAYGMGFMDDRAHFTVAYEYQDTDSVGCFNARDWCREGNGFYQNPLVGAPATATQYANGDLRANNPGPSFLLGTNVRQNQISTTGVFFDNFNRTAATTLQANAAGNGTAAFNLGQQPFSSLSATNVVQGGDGRSIYQYTNLTAPVKRNVGAGTFTFAISDDLNLSLDLSYGKVETTNITGALDATNTRVYADNAFIQGNGLAAAQATYANGGPFALFNKDWTSQLDSRTQFTTEVKRAAIGLDGKFGDSSWGWDAYYQYGKTKREQFVADNRHLIAYLMAIDAVVDGSGNTVCRVTRDGYAAASAFNNAYANVNPLLATGCVPLNAFGNGPLSQAAHDYAFGFLDEQLDYEQQVLAASASGDLFDGLGLGAGPVQGAIGAEYRIEKGENLAPASIPDYVRTDYLIQYGESFAGDVDVTEGFVELNLPVLKDAPGAKKIELNTAARISRYDNEGKFGTDGTMQVRNIFTWKASGIWDPVDWMRVRASQSRDSRSPNFRELYYRQIIAAGGTFGYCGPIGTTIDPCNFDLRGNPQLRPEKSDTTTAGLVFTPKELVPGLQLAADYFRINVQDAINQASSRVVIDGCNKGAGDPALCNLLTLGAPTTPGDPYSNITDLKGFAYNGKGYVYKGVDFTGNYSWDVNDGNNITFRLLGTRMIDQRYQATSGLPEYNVVGQTGTANSFLSDNQSAPKWSGNLAATWNHGPVSVTGQGRFVGHGTFNYRATTPDANGVYTQPPLSGATLNVNRVPSYQVFALSGSYKFENLGVVKDLQIYGVVDNLFDRDPPIAAGNGANANGGTNAIYFDTLGRAFQIGVRTNF